MKSPEKPNGFVFIATNTVTGKFYIGCHVDSPGMTNGSSEQLEVKGGYIGSNTALRDDVRQYGTWSFEKQIVYEGPDFFEEKARLVAIAIKEAPELLYNKRRHGRPWTNGQRVEQRKKLSEIAQRQREQGMGRLLKDASSKHEESRIAEKSSEPRIDAEYPTPPEKTGYVFVTTNQTTGRQFIWYTTHNGVLRHPTYIGTSLLLDDDLERYGLEVFVRELIYEGKDYRRVRRQMLIDAREKAIPLYNM